MQDLYECKPLGARISLKQCEYNRTRGGCHSCANCAGPVPIVTTDRLLAPAAAPAELPENAVLLVFSEPADRALLEQLRAVSADLNTDILSLLHLAIEYCEDDE